MRDAERRDRDQADRARRVGRTQPLDDPEARWTVAARGKGLGGDQLAVGRAAGLGEVDEIFGAVAAVRGNQPPAVRLAAKNADDAA